MAETLDSNAPTDLNQDVIARAGLASPLGRITGLESDKKRLSEQSRSLQSELESNQKNVSGILQRQQKESLPILERMQQQKPPDSKLEQEKIENFKRPTIDPKQLNESFGLMMAAAMLVGAASRTPFYNAMEAMSGAMQGFMKKDDEIVAENLKVYDKNLNAIKERNAARRAEHEDNWKRHQNNLSELTRQHTIIEHKYGQELSIAKELRSGIGDRLKYTEQEMKSNETALTSAYRTLEQMQEFQNRQKLQREQMAQTASIHAADRASRERIAEMRLDESRAARESREARDDEKIREKAKSQGGKPTQTERQHYIDSNQLLKSVDRIKAMLADPVLRKKVDDSRLGQVLSESIESKAIQQFAVRPNLDPDVKRYLNEVLMLRNQYYLDQSGKAVTGGEALRNYGAVVQPGDAADDVLNKMGIASERARSKMRDYETYFPSLAVIRGNDAPAPSSNAAPKGGIKFLGFE
jgi:hypothetical protein